MNFKEVFIWISLLVGSLVFIESGYCEDKLNFDETEALIFILREKGIISDDEASRFLEIYSSQVSGRKSEKETLLREFEEKLNTHTQNMKQQREAADLQLQEMRAEILYSSVPDWVSKLKWKGDIRSRYQADLFDKTNYTFPETDDIYTPANTQRDRHRFRLRARLDLLAYISQNLEAGVRLSTGKDDDPVSTNETMGDYFNHDSFVLNRAYLKWRPTSTLTFTGGRFGNPWFCTDLVWDSDVNFEGMSVNLDFQTSEMSNLFLTIGGFPLQEEEKHKEKWLFGYQLGGSLKPRADLKYRFAVGFFDFHNIEGEFDSPARPEQKDHTSPAYMQKGNSIVNIRTDGSYLPGLVGDYNEINVTARVDCAFFYPVNIVAQFDFVTNIGFEKKDAIKKINDQIANASDKITDWPEETNGYMVSLAVGHKKTKKPGEWKCFFAYKHLEADAVLDAFTDSDFHLGGTNAKGYIFGIQAGIAKNMWVATRWMSADEIVGPQLAIDVMQFDLNVSF